MNGDNTCIAFTTVAGDDLGAMFKGVTFGPEKLEGLKAKLSELFGDVDELSIIPREILETEYTCGCTLHDIFSEKELV